MHKTTTFRRQKAAQNRDASEKGNKQGVFFQSLQLPAWRKFPGQPLQGRGTQNEPGSLGKWRKGRSDFREAEVARSCSVEY